MCADNLIKPGAGSVFLIGIFLLGGCSFLNIGENEYQCPGGQDGMPCTSVRKVYEATGGSLEHFSETAGAGRDEKAGERAGAGSEKASGSLQKNSDTGSLGASALNRASAAEADEIPDPFTLENRKIVGEAYIIPNLPDKPVPVRTPAGVMRIWIAGWEDDLGDLNSPSHVFVEIEPRRWVVGEPERHEERYFAPLEK